MIVSLSAKSGQGNQWLPLPCAHPLWSHKVRSRSLGIRERSDQIHISPVWRKTHIPEVWLEPTGHVVCAPIFWKKKLGCRQGRLPWSDQNTPKIYCSSCAWRLSRFGQNVHSVSVRPFSTHLQAWCTLDCRLLEGRSWRRYAWFGVNQGALELKERDNDYAP